MGLNEPRHDGDNPDGIIWAASIRGKVVEVAMDRETIEDWLVLETSSPEERLRCVAQNVSMLSRCAAARLRAAPDATNIQLWIEDLTSSSDLESTDEG
ncbi:MAG: hypothetical protein AVDCRST_MAG93-4172 [uncultured Chloroflexia bacterium]|uniref:Uncharacterized protein n=1 Tax=uncultured Chloroflexia bacterium TaxID=1672391 RepID=A0A6J4K3G9_9CHLR|nr:MAG: hypothetical protein AVDCRST_MAG93-4172 [uncultured Chloroflexia bacterium]